MPLPYRNQRPYRVLSDAHLTCQARLACQACQSPRESLSASMPIDVFDAIFYNLRRIPLC